MRSAIIAAFAAGALAVPLQERAIVYETEVAYATQYVTVTQGDVAPTPDPAPVPTTSAKKNHLHGHRKPQNYAWTSSWATTWTEAAPAPSSEAEQQAPAYSEPAPAPSSYEAPAPSSYAEPTSTKAQSSAPASSASDAKPTGYQGKVIHHHNIHRANHSAPDLTWSDSLAATAQEIGNSCVYAHDKSKGDGNYGQNIAAGVKADNVSAVITELFYNGEVALFEGQYGKADPDMANFEEWGHFSQIVWKDTTEVGCATVDCTDKGLANTGGNVPPYFTVCNYKSAGNFAGEYADNVLESRGDKTCYWNDAE